MRITYLIPGTEQLAIHCLRSCFKLFRVDSRGLSGAKAACTAGSFDQALSISSSGRCCRLQGVWGWRGGSGACFYPRHRLLQLQGYGIQACCSVGTACSHDPAQVWLYGLTVCVVINDTLIKSMHTHFCTLYRCSIGALFLHESIGR
jgi:hypothetical protein